MKQIFSQYWQTTHIRYQFSDIIQRKTNIGPLLSHDTDTILKWPTLTNMKQIFSQYWQTTQIRYQFSDIIQRKTNIGPLLSYDTDTILKWPT